MSKNKYIKLSVEPNGNLAFYTVLETKNIKFVEPGYTYQVERPKTFKDAVPPEHLENVEVHLILYQEKKEKEEKGTEENPFFVTTPIHNPIEAVNGNE